MSVPHIVVLPGDGIGPEVMASAISILEAVGDFEFDEHPIGGSSIDVHGVALHQSVLSACRRSDAVLLGAVGGSRWEELTHGALTPEQGILQLRSSLELYANLRPVYPFPELYEASPLQPDRLEGVNLLIVRELTGGIYYGPKKRTITKALDMCEYSAEEIERVAHRAFQAARTKVTSVDKANVLSTSRLWREVVTRLHEEAYSHLELEHLLVDNAAMQLVSAPCQFDTILTENMFGDILSDLGAVITGTIGLLPSASLGDGGPGLFEPVHGSAPDIAGKGIANPLAMILSAAMMLRYGLGMEDKATAIETAVHRAIKSGLRTVDLRGIERSVEATRQILKYL